MKGTARHLQRALQQASAPLRESQALPPDTLTRQSVAIRQAGGTGFPASADSLAYDSSQSLLVVGTSDGRIKLIGALGVEAVLQTPSQSPTSYLAFLANRGAILRVTQLGDIQLFSIDSFKLVASTWLQGDAITAVTPLPSAPYLLIGCESGAVRTAALLGEDGQPAPESSPVLDVSLRKYTITPSQTGGRGPVVALATAAHVPGLPLLLLVYRDSGAVVWDIRAQRVLCAGGDPGDKEVLPTAACWLGDQADGFVMGYDNGAIAVHALTSGAWARGTQAGAAPPSTEVVAHLCKGSHRSGPILSLALVLGLEDLGPCLLVRGGQDMGEPDMLSFLPLQRSRGPAKLVPWFGAVQGHALVPRLGSLARDPEAPLSLLVLTEGGQLVVHDLATWQPMPLTLPFQELPPVTVSLLVPTLGPSHTHGLTLEAVRGCSRRHAGGGAAFAPGPGDWPFTGGRAALLDPGAAAAGAHPAGLLLTGHRDGRVRVWDAVAQVPELLMTVPASSGAERLHAVTAIEAWPEAGLVAVGYAGGKVHIFQFCPTSRVTNRVNLDESGVPYSHVSHQPPGFQYILRYSRHTSDIALLAVVRAEARLAVVDAAGLVSHLDISVPAQGGELAASPLGPLSHLLPFFELGAEHRALRYLAVARDGALCLLGPHPSSPMLAGPLRPKSEARPLMAALLGVDGRILRERGTPCPLHWADAGGEGHALSPSGRERSGASLDLARPEGLVLDTSPHLNPARSGGAPLSSRRPSTQGPSEERGSRLRGVSRWSSRGEAPSEELQVEPLPSDGERSGAASREESEDEDAALDAALNQALNERRGGKGIRPALLHLPGSLRRLAGPATSRPAPAAAPAASSSFLLGRSQSAPSSPSLSGPSAGDGPAGVGVEAGRSMSGDALDSARASRPERGGGLAGAGPDVAPGPGAAAAALAAAYGIERDAHPEVRAVADAGPPDELPPAEAPGFIVVCTEHHLRLYAFGTLVEGASRATLRKVAFASPAYWAGAAGGGVVSLHEDGTLTLHSLPGLERLARAPLGASAAAGGVPASAEPTPRGDGPAPRPGPGVAPVPPGPRPVVALSEDGQLALASYDAEVARLVLLRATRAPAAPAATYDWQLAAAAAAAARNTAAGGAEAAGRGAAPRATPLPPPAGPDSGSAPAAPLALGARLFEGVRGTALDVVEGASRLPMGVLKELDRARVAGVSSLQRLTMPGSSGAQPDATSTLPSVEDLFGAESKSESEESIDLDYLPDEVEPGASATGHSLGAVKPVAEVGPLAGAGAALPSSRHGWGVPPPLAGPSTTPREATPPAAGGPRPVNRTVSMVKRTYGRPTTSKRVDGVAGVMAENMQRLGERGEKLSRLEDRTAELEDDAGNFASLAKQLADGYSNRKWWQM
ncbi:hypothetical protein ACKKBF_B35875 [Auxenochlorella protothecoides x Auxenochlorella symbiontica]